MHERKISFETAKLAKEKGFDLYTRVGFDLSGNYLNYDPKSFNGLGEPWGHKYWNRYDEYFAQPTQSLLQKWLRDIHHINVFINVLRISSTTNVYEMWLSYPNKTISGEYYNCYEEALEIGLKEGLNLIKNENTI